MNVVSEIDAMTRRMRVRGSEEHLTRPRFRFAVSSLTLRRQAHTALNTKIQEYRPVK
jgi:hypothetical protein